MRRQYATVRKTEIGSMIESFLDDNSEYLSPFIWGNLEQLAEEVDNMTIELEKQAEEFEEQVERLEEQIERLEEEIETFEECEV